MQSKDGDPIGFKDVPCAVGQRKNGQSCYPDDVIMELKRAWNLKHPDNRIVERQPREVWLALRRKLGKYCATERCWAVKLLRQRRRSDLETRFFAPVAPEKWCRNKREWLDSEDISAVMNGYERAYPSFRFLGPAPVDFALMDDTKPEGWPELTRYTPEAAVREGKYATGLVFNTDPHTEPGQHWISAFIELRPGMEHYIAFSDSNGVPPPDEISSFIKRTRDAYAQSGRELPLYLNKRKHQRKDTECGIYCLHMIMALLEAKYPPSEYFQMQKPDAMMEALREKFYVLDC